MDHNHLQNGSNSSEPKRLACRQCQRRKIRCDRDNPCLQCEQAGITCEQSARKKRARPRINNRREDDLRNRVASLEKLVHRLNGDEAASCAPAEILPSANKYLASPFWSSLAGEVQALKEALEDDGDESDLEPSNSESAPSPSLIDVNQNRNNDSFEFILCGPTNIFVLPDALYEVKRSMLFDLFEVHLERADRKWKIFHAPSLRAFVQNERPFLGYEAKAPCALALKAALCFSGISQLTDVECELSYGQSRSGLLDRLQRTAEMKLIQTDPMNTKALPTLQALVVYVAALRKNDASRRSWAIFALVVRLARALNLHRESTDESLFLRELRRRLWHNIIVLDGYFALDRGSEPIITFGSFSRPLPTNLNDEDFDETSPSLSPRAAEVTDMTFALMGEELSACTQRINFFEDKPAGETWQQRLHLAEAQQRTIEEKYLQYCDPSIDFQRLILKIGRVILTGLALRAVRPMQRDPSNTLPAVDTRWVFELAVSTLRQSVAIGDDVALAKWKQLAWVQWHPIAVVLAGLCSSKTLEPNMEAEAWLLVDRMMAYSSRLVADTKKGSLWQPIEKLYKKAMAAKIARSKQALGGSAVDSTSPDSLTAMSSSINDGLEPPIPAMPTDFPSNQLLMSDAYNSRDITTIAEPISWLDWDALIADIDAASKENDMMWA